MCPSSPGFRSVDPARDRAATEGRSRGREASEGPSPTGAAREPQDLGSVLDQLLGTRPWGGGVRIGRLAKAWVTVVGDRLARETAPIRLEAGVLMVRASSAAWAAQVRFLEREIADRVNRVSAGEPVRSVKVLVDRNSTS